MRFVAIVLLALQCELTIVTGGDEKEHVHFKIYVPEIIKHHIHTKTVFIHVYDPKKKVAPKKNEHVKSHHEDWNIWGSYGYNEEQDDGGHRVSIKTHSGSQPQSNIPTHHPPLLGHQGYVTPFDGLLTSSGPSSLQPIDSAYPALYRPQPEPVNYDDYRANYQSVDHRATSQRSLPAKSVFDNGVTGYSYPPQYAVRENVIEDPPDSSPETYLRNSHEEGRSKIHHTETGHLYTNELSDFYDDDHEESHEALSSESREIEESKSRDGYRYVGDQYLTTRMTT